MEFDRTLTRREVVHEMKMMSAREDEEVEHDPDEVNHLYQEATMPLQDVISKYENAEDEEKAKLVLKNPALAKLGEGSSGSGAGGSGSGSSKTISPFLRGKREPIAKTEEQEDAKNKHIRFDENGDVKAEENGDATKKEDAKTNGEATTKENGDKEVKEEEATNGKDAKKEPEDNEKGDAAADEDSKTNEDSKEEHTNGNSACLLYTSDAADE